MQRKKSKFTKENVIKILIEKSENLFYKQNGQDKEILKAIDIIERHIAPSSFPDW